MSEATLPSGVKPLPIAWNPRSASSAAIRSVTPVRRLRLKTSYRPLVSSATRFVARELKTTRVPSSLTKGVSLSAAVGADIYAVGRTLTKLAACVDVDSLHRLRLPVEHVDMIVGVKLRMARDETLTERDERHESAVAADCPLSARSGVAVDVAADQLGRPRQPVAQQHFGVGIVVAANKVRRFRLVYDKASVGTKAHALRGNPAVTVPLTASGRHAHALGRSSQPIAHEHVGRQVRIAGHEIIGKRHEADEATVS